MSGANNRVRGIGSDKVREYDATKGENAEGATILGSQTESIFCING